VLYVRASQTFLFCGPIFKKFFPDNSLTDSLAVNDTCKHPISLQKHLYLVCQANLFRDPKIMVPWLLRPIHLRPIHLRSIHLRSIHLRSIHLRSIHLRNRLRPHSFETAFIWDGIHLRRHSFETAFIWDGIHLRSHSFETTVIWGHIHLRPHSF